MKAALVRIIRGNVENLVVADGMMDYPPKGYALIPLADDSPVDVEHQWDSVEEFKAPRKFVGITSSKVVEVAVSKYYDSPPILAANSTVEVAHSVDVKVGYIANADGTFTNPNQLDEANTL